MNLTLQILRGTHNSMRGINRYSGRNIIKNETLAEHCFYVPLFAYILSLDIEKKHSITLDKEKILTMGLLHDLEEIVTGDVTTTPKYASEAFRKELGIVGEKLLKDCMLNDYQGNEHIADALMGNHKYYEDNKYDTVETRIVKFADIIQALNYTMSEIQIGNSTMLPVLQEIIVSLNKTFGEDAILKDYIPSKEDVKNEINFYYKESENFFNMKSIISKGVSFIKSIVK